MSRTQVKTKRIETRATEDALHIIRRAAEITGRSVSEFIISAAEKDAHKTIEEEQIVRLSADDQKLLIEKLLNPDAPVPAMKRAFEHRTRLLGES